MKHLIKKISYQPQSKTIQQRNKPWRDRECDITGKKSGNKPLSFITYKYAAIVGVNLWHVRLALSSFYGDLERRNLTS